MLKKLSLALLASTVLASTTFAGALSETDNDHLVFGYYNDSISDWRPLKKASTKAQHGFIISYQGEAYSFLQNHLAVIFGLSYSRWYYTREQKVWDVAMFPAVRLYLSRGWLLNPYAVISAGPSYISDNHFGPAQLGKQFIFQDYVGLGTTVDFAGKGLDLSVKMYHYSNAGIFKHNNGFDVPLVFSLGYFF